MKLIVGTKFQFKLTILIFWIKFVQKRYFRPKTEKTNTANEYSYSYILHIRISVQSWSQYFETS